LREREDVASSDSRNSNVTGCRLLKQSSSVTVPETVYTMFGATIVKEYVVVTSHLLRRWNVG
jgi:hypothetical protein